MLLRIHNHFRLKMSKISNSRIFTVGELIIRCSFLILVQVHPRHLLSDKYKLYVSVITRLLDSYTGTNKKPGEEVISSRPLEGNWLKVWNRV